MNIKCLAPVVAVVTIFGAGSDAAAQSCEMSLIDRHGDERTKIYAASAKSPSLYYVADMDVNTDGAARSYHPDDPRANSIALNNMGNAISRIFDADGNNITCSPRRGACFTRFMKTFEDARDAQYAPTGAPRIETRGIIPWKLDSNLGWKVPCTIQSGPNKGFFVSQTSVVVDATKDECDQGRYLDSLAVNANVLPLGIGWRSQGVITDKTDLVVARDLKTGVVAFGINGDRGPAQKIGEGSIAYVAALSKTTLNGTETYKQIRKLARPEVQYVIFPTKDIRRMVGNGFSQSNIDRIGAEVFEEWGGVTRLDSCLSLSR